jgi:hypothetical protein
MVAQTQSRGRSRGRGGGDERVAIVAADSMTGATVGELNWKWRDFPLTYDDWWLDEETLLIATRSDFLAWRPRTGEVFRVTDARTVSDSYWSLTVASQAAASISP